MKTHVEFRSNKFPPYGGEEAKINPGLWGKRLAEYFVQKLPQKGIVATSMIPEDWGWYVPVEVASVKLAICCGHQYGDDNQFLCFTDPSTPIVRRFFKKRDVTAELTKLIDAIRDILASDPDIHDVVWMDGEGR